MGDPFRGSLRGWAVLLADALREASPGLKFTNLARRGATAAVVRRSQVPRAVEAAPDLVTLLVGVNDVTTPGAFQPGRFHDDLDDCLSRLHAVGARVVIARLHDPVARLPLPGGIARGVRRRVEALNAIVDEVSARHGPLVVDLGASPGVRESATWSLDRLHPAEPGHRLLAAAVADLLREDGVAVGRVAVTPPPDDRGDGAAGHLRWLAADGGPWFLRQQARALSAAGRAAWSRRHAGNPGAREAPGR